MCAEDKLKAVQFWNVVSEKLQEIVNNSAADINALAFKLDKNNVDEITLESHSGARNNMTVPFLDAPDGFVTNGAYSTPAHYDSAVGPNTQQMDLMALATELTSVPPPAPTIPVPHSQTTINPLATQTVPSNRQIDSDSLLIPMSKNGTALLTQSRNQNQATDLLVMTQTMLPSDDSSSKSFPNILEGLLNPEKSPLPIITSTESLSTNAKDKDDPGVGNSWTASKCKSKGSGKKKAQSKIIQMKSEIKATSQNSVICQKDEKLSPQENISKRTNAPELMNGDEGKDDSEEILEEASNNTEPEENDDDEDDEEEEEEEEEEEDEEEENDKFSKSEENGEVKKTTQIIVIKTGKGKSDKKYICEWCNKELPSHSALTSHLWIHTKPYVCSECESRFSTKGNLIVHQRRHTGEKPFKCINCNAVFTTRGNLKRHIRTHSGEKPWECTQCGGRFTEKKSLKVHMRRHTGEKPYQCRICGKRFAQTGILQTHMAMHLDQKSHLCEHCGKSFRQRSQLKLHTQRHEGVRKYSCDSCPAKFLTKGDLERHNRVHTGERPFVCEICGKSFTRQQSLNEHMNRHYGIKPYECKYCGRAFAEMSACYKHIKHHERLLGDDETSEDAIQVLSGQSGGDSNPLQENEQLTNAATEKYSVLIQTGEENSLNVEQPRQQHEATNEQTLTATVSDHISDFTAINLLANASSFQQNF